MFASPCAICGSVCRYWYASTSGVGLLALIAANTFSTAFACPCACRYFAARSPCARRMCDCRSASASRIAACFDPSAARIWLCFCPSAVLIADSRSPSAVRIIARFSRSARICFSIESWIDGGGSIAFSSTRATRMPHRPVASSNTPRNWLLI